MRHIFAHHLFLIQESSTSSGQSIWPEFWGGFTGAFFAFLFGIISYLLIKRYERFILHRDAIVKLERALNDALDVTSLNLVQAAGTVAVLRQSRLTHNRLIKFELPPDVSLEIGSIALVNEYQAYERLINRINYDFAAVNYTLTRLEDMMIGGNPVAPQNFTLMIDALNRFPRVLNNLDAKTKRLLCIIRIYLAKLKRVNRFWFAVSNKDWDMPVTEAEIAAEMAMLEAEIERVVRESTP